VPVEQRQAGVCFTRRSGGEAGAPAKQQGVWPRAHGIDGTGHGLLLLGNAGLLKAHPS